MSTPIGSFVNNETPPVPVPDNSIDSDVCEVDFFDRHSASATRYAMSIVRRWSVAEEIAQEAFCKMIATTDASSAEARMTKAFLFTTVRNMSIDKLRQQNRQRFEPMDANQIANRSAVSDERNLRSLETRIEFAMKQLPETWADALQLKVNGGLSYAEIAEVLSATHNQIRTWIYRARKQLQTDLDEFELSGGVTS